jgi:hypothetical protein
LNGIVAHYITNGTPKSILLALPEQNEAHTGANIAVEVLRVIHEFKINTRIGYFVLDNASNNDTCMRELAEELGFNPIHRRLRCAGHVINLIARALLFGENPDLFEHEAEQSTSKSVIEQLRLWRRFGPIGKLHNTIIWIYKSPQRVKRFKQVQQQQQEDNPD